MGFFSNISSKLRVSAIQLTWQDSIIPMVKLIQQRGLMEEYKKSVKEYLEEAIEAAKYQSLKGQIKAAKSSHAYAFSIKDSDIVNSCALYTVSIYVEVFCRIRNDDDAMHEYSAFLSYTLEEAMINLQMSNITFEFKKLVAPELFNNVDILS